MKVQIKVSERASFVGTTGSGKTVLARHFLQHSGERILAIDPKHMLEVPGFKMGRKLPLLKKENPWLKEVSAVPLQQSLLHLDRAFSNFFKRLTKYPTVKSRYGDQSASYMKNSFKYANGEIRLAKLKEPLDIRWSRKFKETPTSLTISKNTAGDYYISIIVKEEVEALPFVKSEIGLDLGLLVLYTDHLGNEIPNPRFLVNGNKRLRRKQKALSRKVKGSKNRGKARKNLARFHSYVRNKRHDFLHKVSWQVVNENQVIAVEDLQVKDMQKNRRLSRSIGDAGWGTFLRFLEYKCDWYGREFVKVDTFFPSSKRCSSCGHVLTELKLSIRVWSCPSCKESHHRDSNAGKNILQEGKRLLGNKKEVPWDARDVKPVEFV